MKRWGIAFVAVVAACFPILLGRATSPNLLKDTDTAVLLSTIRARNAPFSWVASDWPLFNHFYRPVSTLAFEADNRLYGNNAWGYGLTNSLLCVACVLLLFWFLAELTERPIWAAGGALLFAIWQWPTTPTVALIPYWLAYATLAAGIIRHQHRVRHYLPAFLILWVVQDEIVGIQPLSYITQGWLPGRTATVMTVFALAAMAAYARSERLRGRVVAAEPITPLTAPATKGTKLKSADGGASWPWVAVSVVAAALALGSYEQAVMLPACLLAVAVTMRLRGYRPHWGWHAAFWSLLVGYLMVRHAVIPPGTSGYQRQQHRTGIAGVWIAGFDYGFPPMSMLTTASVMAEAGIAVLFDPHFYTFLIDWTAWVTTTYQARKDWIFAFAGWGMSVIAFLPMAFFKSFAHYHYWPMALRSLWVVALIALAARLVVTAWCPRAQQAPQRLAPAPGSLPHR